MKRKRYNGIIQDVIDQVMEELDYDEKTVIETEMIRKARYDYVR